MKEHQAQEHEQRVPERQLQELTDDEEQRPTTTEADAKELEQQPSSQATGMSALLDAHQEPTQLTAAAARDTRQAAKVAKAAKAAKAPRASKVVARKASRKSPSRRGSTASRGAGAAIGKPPKPCPLAPLLTAPALLRGEDRAEYEDLLARVIDEVRPDGGIELVLVHDLVGRSWEIARYRRAKAADVSSLERPALGQLLQSLGVEDSERADLLTGWMSGDTAARARVRALLAAAGWDESVIHARSLAAALKTLEGIEDLQLTAEASRAGSWNQLIRHRADLADRFAQPQALIDAAYTEVDEQGSDEEDA